MSDPPRGRRPGTPDTRSALVESARHVFAERGYSAASIRGIAREAGVDPSLVLHYFGSKEDLFAEAMEVPAGITEVLGPVLSGDPEHLGERLARAFFSVWEQPAPRSALLGMLRGALGGDEEAVRPFREFITETVGPAVARAMGGADADARALAMASHLVGVAVVRYVVKVEPLSSASIDEIVDLVGPRLQSYADG
jgi:AcrR family transcriptional regulator